MGDSKERVAYSFFAFLLFFIILLFRVYTIQIRQRFFLNRLADSQYGVTKTSNFLRAQIYDRSGQALALNQDTYAAFITPKKMENKEGVAAFLQRHFLSAYKNLLTHQLSPFLYIKRRLTAREQELIQSACLSDIKLLIEQGRFYPVQGLGSVLGLTDSDNKGVLGLELYYDKQLAGRPATYTLQRDARSGHFYFKKETKIAGAPGTALMLTIDGTLQFLCFEELKEACERLQADEGAVLVIDPEKGDIIVMTNYPDLDRNGNQYYAKNRVVTERYELGSVMKMFFALAAFEEQVISPDELVDCLNTTTTFIDGVKIGTTRPHGIIPFREVIIHSNNIGCAKVAHRLGPKLYDFYKKIGFGEKTAIGFPGEQAGFIIPPEKWSRSSLFTLSYGYGISATLMQLARAFCMIANGGYLVEPRLILAQPIMRDQLPRFSKHAINQICSILEQTVLSGKRANIDGYTVFGKTGTANLLENGEYNTEHNIFTFAGCIQKGSYKRVIITFIKGKGSKTTLASAIAAPLFKSVAQKMLIHDKIVE